MYALVVDMISVALGHSTIDDPAREAKLLADYAGQLAAVEVATGRVRRVDAFALRQLKYVAAGGLYDDDYGLSGLMDELSRIFAEQEIAARYADGAEVPANVQSVCLHGYGPLKGQLGDRIPASAAEADPVEFEIELEGSVHGIGLDEGDTYRSSFLELPEQGKQLCSGVEPSHVFTCGVLFGAVVEVNWELADRKTGEIRSSHRAVLVPEDTACLRACAVRGLVDGDGRVYVDSGSPDCAATGEWASMARFEEDLLEDPIRFLTGDAGAVCPGCGR